MWKAIEAQFAFSLVGRAGVKRLFSANWRENGSFTLWIWVSSYKKLKYRSNRALRNTSNAATLERKPEKNGIF
jgi:hypothetical protein